jgi:hypothetical protein
MSLYRLTLRATMEVAQMASQSRIIEGLIAHACFDESGKWKDSAGVFVFAGIVIFQVPFQALTDKWAHSLKTADLSHTSMKEAMHFEGPYRKFKDNPSGRDAVLRNLAKDIMEAPSIRVASSLETATLETFNALSSDEQKKFGGNPYYAAFEACILGALSPRVDTLVHIVCDLAEEYSEKCVSAFHELRRLRSDIKNRCVGIAFADDERHAGLQVADFIAYCARAETLEKLGRVRAAPIVREIIDMFNTQDQTVHSVLYNLQGDWL